MKLGLKMSGKGALQVVADDPERGVPELLTENQIIIETLKQLVEPIGQSMVNTEVVVHDLSALPNSIVAIHGDLTGRKVGSPATDLLLQQTSQHKFDSLVGYHSVLSDGRETRSTTIAVRNSAGEPVAALCTNSDIGVWQELSKVVSLMTDNTRPATEAYVQDVDELTDLLLQRAVALQQVPVELMRKEHKLEVVRQVRAGGMFLLRDAVETVAAALRVSRFTIYNYINEIEQEETGIAPPKADDSK